MKQKQQLAEFNEGVLNILSSMGSSYAGWHKQSAENIESHLQRYRAAKKFSAADPTDKRRLAQEAWVKFCKQNDRMGEYSLTYFQTLGYNNLDVRAVRAIIHFWFRDFDLKEALRRGRFGPGDSFTPYDGWNSEYDKYFNQNLQITKQSESICRSFALSDRVLRCRILRLGWRVVYKLADAGKLSLAAFKNRPSRAIFRDVFDAGFTQVERVPGTRYTTVEKDAERRRGINIEPCLTQFAQQGVSSLLVKHLKCKTGVNLLSGQSHHGNLIRFVKFYATADFSEASDTNALGAVEYFFPPRLAKTLLSLRSSVVVGPDGEWIVPNMYACMGNGLTFIVMTVILYACAYILSKKHLKVWIPPKQYGDDALVANAIYDDFMELTRLLGYLPNHAKSFAHDDASRESCGKYYAFGRYLTSFDFKWATHESDVITLGNKALLNYLASGDELFYRLYSHAMTFVDSSQMGPLPSASYRMERLSDYLFAVTNIARLTNAVSKRLTADLQYPVFVFEKWTFLNNERPLNARGIDFPLYVKNARTPKRIQRDGKWVKEKYLATVDGDLLGSVKALRRRDGFTDPVKNRRDQVVTACRLYEMLEFLADRDLN